MRIGDLTWTDPATRSNGTGGVTERSPEAVPQSNREIAESVKVALSERAEKALKSSSNQDIDDCDLPEVIKRLLKHIRELKQQIAEVQQQITELARQQGLPDEERSTLMDGLRSQLASLSSALSTAYASLAKAMKQQALSDEQRASMLKLLNE
jgi:Sec-independent protein translocase protein TatA